MKDLAGKEIAVFGAAGSIGKAVCRRLKILHARPYAFVKNHYQSKKLGDMSTGDDAFPIIIGDVTSEIEMSRAVAEAAHLSNNPEFLFDGIVYCVGHCPTGGLLDQIQNQLLTLVLRDFEQDWRRLVLGLCNVYKKFGVKLEDGSALVVIGSAITRFEPDQLPPSFYVGPYASAQAAQAELVKWIRHEPLVTTGSILVHRLAFGAVNTPFHHGPGPKPKNMLTVTDTVDQIISALESDEIIDKMVYENEV